ncbi:hypothetical protein Cgig2_001907 [Carnegiea gigantea]|uniref:Photosystem I iron-sulfur center n=1 Tax=Carnegiea gigantea TaxID=171969 RepID=A0A9Q1K850_9CARY|nr:hypothetical protein Cgig2_001907 [Carnegiea gigantea]
MLFRIKKKKKIGGLLNFNNNIKRLTSHLKLYKKDYSSQRGIRKIPGKWQQLLAYLFKKDKAHSMSHSVKIYDTCIGCTQCVRACPTDVLEMVHSNGCQAKQIASAPRAEDCFGCKKCESACPTDFLSVRVYLGPETTRSYSVVYYMYFNARATSNNLRILLSFPAGRSINPTSRRL